MLSPKVVTHEKPKLRGVAIAPLLARLYDGILDQRFNKWYAPNHEQADFRNGQGCLLQLFILVLLIHFAKEEKQGLFIGFMEKKRSTMPISNL